MVLAALNAEHREQYRSWERVNSETGEVLWEDRARLDEFADGVVKTTRAALTAALAVAPNVDDRAWDLPPERNGVVLVPADGRVTIATSDGKRFARLTYSKELSMWYGPNLAARIVDSLIQTTPTSHLTTDTWKLEEM